MKTTAQHKPRLLWIAIKLFDKSVDKATWLETMRGLEGAFDIHFLAAWRDRPEAIDIAGKPIRYFPQHGRGILRKLTRQLLMPRAARREIRTLSPDIVLLNCNHDLRVLRSVGLAAMQVSVPAILDIRTLPTTEAEGAVWESFRRNLDCACRHFAGVTYITEEMRRYCVERFGLPEHRSTIWTSGVNAEAFRPDAAATANDALRLIYHGGIISVSRGLDRLIQAMDRVRDLDVHLTLISSLREPEAIGWIDRLNLRDRVTLVDTIPHADVPAAIQRHDAGILPFPSCDIWNTSSPIKLFEYMSCGKPVVVTDIPAHRNVLDGKSFAFFARDATPDALADAIRRAHAARASFPETGDQARRQVLERHTWERQAESLGGFLMSLLAERQTIKP